MWRFFLNQKRVSDSVSDDEVSFGQIPWEFYLLSYAWVFSPDSDKTYALLAPTKSIKHVKGLLTAQKSFQRKSSIKS